MKIFIAIPALNEADHLPGLISDLKDQTFKDFAVFVCVNNPEEWHSDPEKVQICDSNDKTIDFLRTVKDLHVTVIDRASKGKGWTGKKRGVGYARKELFDAIYTTAEADDLVISLDADTRVRPGFADSVRHQFAKHKKALLLTNPYYHELSGKDDLDRAILRYELYMRYYLLNLFKIKSPYAFTALGSAISFRIGGYRKISGITPKEAGEDFYFVNRMKKAGHILIWNDETVFPSSRESDRVPFGTGPAVTKGKRGDWDSYPFYDQEGFKRIWETYKLFPKLFIADCETPIDDFIDKSFGENIWEPLRKNFKTEKLFIRACHEKLDGLKILQILRFYQEGESLKNFIEFSREYLNIKLQDDFSFETCPVPILDEIRISFYKKESELRSQKQFLI